MIVSIIALLLLFYFFPFSRYLERRGFASWESKWRKYGSCSYSERGSREVIHPPARWEVIQRESGDVDVLPIGEDHIRGASCICSPRVDIEGACLVIVHNSFDNREIVEEAIRIMNGVE